MTDAFLQVAQLPGVQEAADDARKAVDRLRGHRMLRRKSPEVSTEAALRGARASAALEGADAHLEEVRSGTAGDPRISGALRVSAELGLLTSIWSKAPRQVLARLHVLAASDAVSGDDLGRPRSTGTPSPSEVAARLDGLSSLLVVPSTAPALVVGAVVHGELLALRPFGWGDGIVARAAQRLTFIERGLDPKSLTAPEIGHAELAAEYATAHQAYLSGTSEGVATWVRHCADAVIAAARDSQAICEAFQRG